MQNKEQLDPRVVRTQHDVPAVALRLLIDEGWESVTPARVAEEAGYSRATVYAHWPDRTDLVRDAFSQYEEMPHFEPSGDPAIDLRGELVSFCRAMVESRLDRALATLAERAQTNPEIAPVRDRFVAAGEAQMRQTLGAFTEPIEFEASVQMLCGMVTHSALMHGSPPSDEVIDAAVGVVLRGLTQRA